MVRKLFRAGLWGVKGVLLLIALGALFLWPWSYSHPQYVLGDRWRLGTDRVEYLRLSCTYREGRIDLFRRRTKFTKSWLPEAMERPREKGPGLTWRTGKISKYSAPQNLTWGLYGWERDQYESVEGLLTVQYCISFPTWLLALITGVWPITSIALLIRRRRRARRLRRSGCCLHCGYDLRAASDGPDARCPECGTAARTPSQAEPAR